LKTRKLKTLTAEKVDSSGSGSYNLKWPKRWTASYCRYIPIYGWLKVMWKTVLLPIADAILDWLVHSSHRIEIDGNSLREKYKNYNSYRFHLILI